MKKIVIFGAGKIGRSFIGQLFSRSGYEVVFIDLDQELVNLLNEHRQYKVVIKGEQEENLLIRNVRAVMGNQPAKVIGELKNCDLIAISVGKAALPKVLPLVAEGLKARWSVAPENKVDIILAENMRDAAEFSAQELNQYFAAVSNWRSKVGLVETSIGKMVPIMSARDLKEDPLQVFAEPYNTLILDGNAFVNPVPEVERLAPKQDMKAWVDRKSFIHNLGHAVTAYLGYLFDPGFKYTYQVLAISELKSQVKATMQQSAEMLLMKYPEAFSAASLGQHIDDLLDRFANQALGDTIFRVGLDLKRKLGPDDRLVGAIRLCQQQGLPYHRILYAVIAGMYFRATDDQGHMYPQDKSFMKMVHDGGISVILKEVCDFDPGKNRQIYSESEKINQEIIDRFKPQFQLKM